MPVALTDSQPTVTGELIDALIEAVVVPPDPRSRSAVICDLVQEISAAVQWQYPAEMVLDAVAQDELVSIRQLAIAAQDHRGRMDAAAAGTAETVPSSSFRVA